MKELIEREKERRRRKIVINFILTCVRNASLLLFVAAGWSGAAVSAIICVMSLLFVAAQS
jgi:CHASE2 domain-containing sensor protein